MIWVSRLRDLFERDEFVVTGEVAPPLGTDLSHMLDSVETIGKVCHAINVTDNQGATLHLSSLAASKALLEAGHEPIFQQTCRDRNRLALQSDLMAAWTLGLQNILVVTGDDPRGGDHPGAKGVFDLDSTQLIEIASGMNEGKDMIGREIEGATDFTIGAALFPEAEPWDIQHQRARRKIAAGATFFQTQAIFDLDKFERAASDLADTGVRIIAGILLLKSPGVIDFINDRLAGLMIPDDIADRIQGAADPVEESIRLAIEQAEVLRELAHGVHIMPLGMDEAVVRIVEEAQLRG